MDSSTGAIAPSAPAFPAGWPSLGLGCAPLGDILDLIPEPDAAAMLAAAWNSGVRFYDTAPWYGHGLSEHRLGASLRQYDRDEALISTKVGRVYEPAGRNADARIQWRGGLNFSVRYDYSAAGFEQSLAQSRMRLGQSSVDALVIHDLDRGYQGPDFDRHLSDLTGSGLAWLRNLKAEGQISAVGVGINVLEDFADLADWIDVDYFLVAMPYTLLDQCALAGPMARCIERNIKIVIGAPFASGLLTDPAQPGLRYNYAPASTEIRDKALRIQAVCDAYDVPIMAAALRFPLLHPAVLSVIPGANTADQVRQNVASSRYPIPPELWQSLKQEGLIDSASPTD